MIAGLECGECPECGSYRGPAEQFDGEDALVLLREVSCEAGVHYSRTLGPCRHTAWCHSVVLTAAMMNDSLMRTLALVKDVNRGWSASPEEEP